VILPLFDDWCIRSLAMSDAESIARYANNWNVWINVRDLFPHPYSLNDAKTFLKVQVERTPENAWAIARLPARPMAGWTDGQASNEAIGVIGYHLQSDVNRKCAEIGYWLGEPFWRRGIGTAAVKAVTSHVFANLDVIRLYAAVFEWNPGSARVLEKAGYQLESRMRKAVVKNGQIIDQFMYVMLREEWEANQNSKEIVLCQ
jgi:ribosomal-protein-alanine N-acetyltransferase